MMTVVPDVVQLRRAIELETPRVAGLLRAARDPAAQVPGLTWTALEVASHLAVALHALGDTVLHEQPTLDLPAPRAGQTMPQFLAAANEVTRHMLPCTTLSEAADAVESGGRRVLQALESAPDLEAELPTPWYGPGQVRTAGTLCALAVSETLVHGYDIAAASGGARRVSERSARAAAATVMTQMLPLVVSPNLPDAFAVRYGVRIRGDESFVVQVSEGRASTAAPDDEVDCVISLTARAALMVGFRRVPLWRAVLTGAATATGRRPWAAWHFGSVFESA